MKKAVVIALVVVVAVTGLPLVVGAMGMTSCSQCPAAVAGPMTCAAVLVAAAFVISLLVVSIRQRRFFMPALVWARLADPPPRLI